MVEGADAGGPCRRPDQGDLPGRLPGRPTKAGTSYAWPGRSSAHVAAPHLVLLSSLAAREPAISPYAASKAAGEAALAASSGLAAWTILRPPVVYGPGDPATRAAFSSAVAKGIGPILAPEGARVSFLHVADLCGAVCGGARPIQTATQGHDLRARRRRSPAAIPGIS